MLLGIIASEAYHAPASLYSTGIVRFDNTNDSSYLGVASQTIADSPNFTLSAWIRGDADSIANNTVYMDIGSEETYVFWNPAYPIPSAQLNFYNSALSFYTSADNPGDFVADALYHIYVACQTNFAAGLKKKYIYVNGVPVSISSSDAGASFNLPFNGKAFGIPLSPVDAGSQIGMQDFADVWIDLANFWDPTTYIGNFYDAHHPVDLGADGSTPTGTSPTYFFTGTAATTFLTNSGSGPAVTHSGTITDVGTLS